MSISEARRQINLALNICDNEIGYSSEYVLNRVLAHGFNAIVEALAENKPYDGSLNAIRIPVTTLRQISVELVHNDLEDIGLEDLILSIRTRVKNSEVDKS